MTSSAVGHPAIASPVPVVRRGRPSVGYLVQAELNYFVEAAARGGIGSVANDWIRKVREGFLWRVRRASGGPAGPTVDLPVGRLIVNPSDRGISRELLVYGTHEPAATRLLSGFLEEGDTVVDVGANIGYYVLHERRIVGGRGAVIAIEPAPRNAELLRANIALNGLDAVQVVDGAIGDHDGPGRLYLSDRSNWHSMTPTHPSQTTSVAVDVFTLDALVERLGLPRVDFVRMDLEGHETAVIRAMLRTLATHRPKLAIELHPPKAGVDGIVALLRLLESFGYDLRWVVNRRLDFSWHPGRQAAVETIRLDEYARSDQLLREGRTVTAFFAYDRPADAT